MDISTLTLAELKVLYDQLPAEISRREKEERAKVLRDINALAAEHGFKLDDLTDSIRKSPR